MLKRWQVAPLLLLLTASAALAQVPDPRDSIILESKTVAPGLVGNSVAFTMKVYITNKDTIGVLALGLRESTIVGSAYAPLDSTLPEGEYQYPGWSLLDCLTFLKNTLDSHHAENFSEYDGASPDRFFVGATWAYIYSDPMHRSEPPNATRSAIWELQFMGTNNSLGTVRIDTARPSGFTILFNRRGQYLDVADIPVNFLPGVISVQLAPKGDLNWDFALRPADIVLLLNCVMLGAIPPVGLGYCDLNCDGMSTIADIVLELNAVYREEEFPC